MRAYLRLAFMFERNQGFHNNNLWHELGLGLGSKEIKGFKEGPY
jgi:hypothetical protein